MKRTAMTLALAAILAGTSHAAILGKKPDFMDKQQLAAMRAEAVSNAIKETEDAAFFTGKLYLASADGYAFKYRSYSPGIARWTSEDPSGFPDGANAGAYFATPTSEFDYLGLYVQAKYSITKRILTIGSTEYNNINSGDNLFANIHKRGGPLPTGSYEIFTRALGAPTYGGHSAFILDPIDGTRYNDIWDGTDADGRTAFRIHLDGETDGCLATASIDTIATQLLKEKDELKRYDIIQTNRTADPVTFTKEYLLGKLWVVE